MCESAQQQLAVSSVLESKRDADEPALRAQGRGFPKSHRARTAGAET